MRILVVNDTSTNPNQGCQATMHMFNAILKKIFPDSPIERVYLDTTNYPYNSFEEKYYSTLNYIKKLMNNPLIKGASSESKICKENFIPNSSVSVEQALKNMLSTNFKIIVDLREKIEWSELVIINGEGSVIDYQSNSRFIFMVCELCSYFNKPFHLINFTAHITSKKTIQLAKSAFSKCSSVSVREPLSYYLTKEFYPNVKVFPDIVLGIDKYIKEEEPPYENYVMIGGGSATIRIEKDINKMNKLKKQYDNIINTLISNGLNVLLAAWKRDEWLQDLQKPNTLFEMTNFNQYFNYCKNAVVNFTGRHHGCVLSFSAGCPFITTTANCFKNFGNKLLYTSPSKVFEMENLPSEKVSEAILKILNNCEEIKKELTGRKKLLYPFYMGAFENIVREVPDLVDEGIIPKNPSPDDLTYIQNMTP